jgi:hypothetical protein
MRDSFHRKSAELLAPLIIGDETYRMAFVERMTESTIKLLSPIW